MVHNTLVCPLHDTVPPHTQHDLLAIRPTAAYLAGVNTHFVMTILGRDRPGLVDRVASTIAQHGGNWLESRMARLGGQFAGLLRAEVPVAQESQLLEALRALESEGLAVAIHTEPSASADRTTATRLELLGHDRPGIIRQISAALARHRVNLEELESQCESAPMTGEILFRARAQIHIPADCDRAVLQAELERIAADLMVDLRLNAP
jgi:glycine cleavage system regulatory protein